MGQQQLALLVLGIVIVALGVVVGIQAFAQSQQSARRDQTHQLAVELAARAQAWKLTPRVQGGGAGGDAADFSAFTLGAVGLQATEGRGGAETLRRSEYTCLKVVPSTEGLVIETLDADCTDGSWWSRVTVTGPSLEDIAVTVNEGAAGGP